MADGGRSGERVERVEQLDGVHVVVEALRARRRKLIRLQVAGEPSAVLQAAADEAGIAIERIAVESRRARDERGNPQGVLLDAGPLPVARLEELWNVEGEHRRIVLLDGVEDPHNLGAIARVAEAAGAVGIVTGSRRSAPLSPAATRASAGALEWLPVARVANLGQAIKQLKEKGFWVVGADLAASDSVFELSDRALSGDLVVALGAEGRGLRPGVLAAVDYRVRIPMQGRVGSLNVSTAGAVILFELLRRRLS